MGLADLLAPPEKLPESLVEAEELFERRKQEFDPIRRQEQDASNVPGWKCSPQYLKLLSKLERLERHVVGLRQEATRKAHIAREEKVHAAAAVRTEREAKWQPFAMPAEPKVRVDAARRLAEASAAMAAATDALTAQIQRDHEAGSRAESKVIVPLKAALALANREHALASQAWEKTREPWEAECRKAVEAAHADLIASLSTLTFELLEERLYGLAAAANQLRDGGMIKMRIWGQYMSVRELRDRFDG